MKHKNCKTCECNKPWVPGEYEIVWVISVIGDVFPKRYSERYEKEFGNYFKTKADAESARDKVKSLLLKLKK